MLKPKMQTKIFKLALKYSSSFWTVLLFIVSRNNKLWQDANWIQKQQ